jgi:cytochrome c biogenesis protein CcdA
MGRGFRLMWAGPLILPVLLIAAAAHASRAVIIALLVALVVIFLIGFVIMFIGVGINKHGA